MTKDDARSLVKLLVSGEIIALGCLFLELLWHNGCFLPGVVVGGAISGFALIVLISGACFYIE